jgi:hypothetical protein
MPGYPIAWTEGWTAFDPNSGSPYDATEVQNYLVGCHAQFFPLGPRLAFRSVDLVLSKSCTNRRFWLWQLVDEDGASWFAVVGSGACPFAKLGAVDRWIYAQTNDDDLTPEEFLDREITKHP